MPFIFGTIIELITMKDSYHIYDIEYTTNLSYKFNVNFVSFLTEAGAHILHNDCLWCVDYKRDFSLLIKPWSQGSRSNIFNSMYGW